MQRCVRWSQKMGKLLNNLQHQDPQLCHTGLLVNPLSCRTCHECLRRQLSTIRPEHFSPRRYAQLREPVNYLVRQARLMCDKSSIAKSAAPATTGSSQSKVDNRKTVVKVVPTKKSEGKTKIDISKAYLENLYITPVKAMNEYLLTSKHLSDLTSHARRSPFSDREVITVYKRGEVERKALEVWGSMEALQKERKRRIAVEDYEKWYLFNIKRAKRAYEMEHEEAMTEKPFIFKGAASIGPAGESLFKTGSGKVVLSAIGINLFNCIIKFCAWLYSGSHSMFAEALHSLADTINQIILAIGLHQSLKEADTEYPYGWGNFRYISALISGVGIFCIGAGLSWYHGVQGLLHPQSIESLFWGIVVLGGSFLSEGATLLIAINQIRKSARQEKVTFWEYVSRGIDPSVNVVLLEDLAAVIGVGIAASCMGLSYYQGHPMPDAIGSLLIGGLLGGVAAFIIQTNISALVGRSIHPEKKAEITKDLENDRLIRALYDVKATDLGASQTRFKAEIDFDGRELTRLYLERQDMDTMLNELQTIQNIEDMETFMLKHGEKIVDTLGGEVDRIEKNLKSRHPQLRHVDLEQL